MLRDKMLAVMDEVNSEAAERQELVRMIALALLSGSNLFILGAPGQAKSFAVNEFRKRITGARQFERLLSKQTDEEALFGRLDLASLIPGAVPAQVLAEDGTYQSLRAQLAQVAEDFRADPADNAAMAQLQSLTEKLEQYQKGLSLLHGGTPMTITAGKIPDAHICFLDEIFKAADGLLNSLLTALNEHRYTNEGVTVDIPVISFFSASNELPNFRNKEEQILAPLYDRFQLRVVTKDVQERVSRLAVLRNKQGGHFGEVTATFTLDELYAMQAQVKLVAIPDAINELMDDVLCELRREGVTVSDRTFFGYSPVAQAAAWLAGHAEVQPEDLLQLKNYLWNEPAEIEKVQAVLTRLCDDPLRTRLEELLAKAKDTRDAFDDAPHGQKARALVQLRAGFASLGGVGRVCSDR
nr:AAA family ATPase [uncultured Agathobaculum sp.]